MSADRPLQRPQRLDHQTRFDAPLQPWTKTPEPSEIVLVK
jgi:hypothetical protein